MQQAAAPDREDLAVRIIMVFILSLLIGFSEFYKTRFFGEKKAHPNSRFKFQKRSQLFIRTQYRNAFRRRRCAFDDVANVIETQEHAGDFKKW